jgi:hypothetical protein
MEIEKESINFRPSLEKVMKDLDGFEYELKMYVYHKLNGREAEAQTYLDTYRCEQHQIKEELTSDDECDEKLIKKPKVELLE